MDAVKKVKAAGLTCRYSLMKAYVLSAEELAEEAAMLETCGLDEITIMDSAGTMMPHEVEAYVKAMTAKVHIPVAFHGHNNLGLSVANALAAQEAGVHLSLTVDFLAWQEVPETAQRNWPQLQFQRKGLLDDVDLLKLLELNICS